MRSTTLERTYERQPEHVEALLEIPDVDTRTLRALALVAERLEGARPRFRNPARFSFVHEGKDGIPYPVDRCTYDATIQVMEKAVSEARVGRSGKMREPRRLARMAYARSPPTSGA